MCGIVGYIGKKEKTLEVLLNGLSNLEYRGYDSAGIAYQLKDKAKIIKSVGKINKLKEKVDFNDCSEIGIGHTRWATHGEVNEVNSHPHRVGSITLVHNGIIENYKELKELLIEMGYEFKTETDTEVACALIDKFYQENNDIEFAMKEAIKKIEGSYAFGILADGKECLYVAKNNSPIIIGIGEEENFVASDVPAILEYTNKYLLLNDKEFACISRNKVSIYNEYGKELQREFKVYEGDLLSSKKDGYDHFMLKEMYEEPKVFKRLTDEYLKDGLDHFIEKMPHFNKYEKIDIVACGSAYHAGLIGKNLIEEYADMEVNVDIASEYRYKKLFSDKKTLVIVISQSGETADTLAALNIAKTRKCDTLAIVNVRDSSIARNSDFVLYTNAGPEIAVATTKAYSAQVIILALITLNIALSKNKMMREQFTNIMSDISKLPTQMEELLKNENYKVLANEIYHHEDIYFLGRKIDYALAMEGSLKLKEISYIHSEAYAAGELKHGTISLIDKGTPVIGILTDDSIIPKTISNMKETKARGAKVIAIKTEEVVAECDIEINIPKTNKLFQPLLTVIPLQCIAYEVAKLRKCDIDQPKNLAKSVTVE